MYWNKLRQAPGRHCQHLTLLLTTLPGRAQTSRPNHPPILRMHSLAAPATPPAATSASYIDVVNVLHGLHRNAPR